jgi:hypothetical protein
MNDSVPAERERGIKNNTHLMQFADELWVYGDWQNSKGCLAEIELAKTLNLTIKYKL